MSERKFQICEDGKLAVLALPESDIHLSLVAYNNGAEKVWEVCLMDSKRGAGYMGWLKRICIKTPRAVTLLKECDVKISDQSRLHHGVEIPLSGGALYIAYYFTERESDLSGIYLAQRSLEKTNLL